MGMGVLLVDAHPWVVDQWAGDPELLGTVMVSSPVKVLWRCPVGHEFVESPHVRGSLQAWKRGQVDACPFCVRHLYPVAYRCGHVKVFRASSAPESVERHAKAALEDCYGCRPNAPRREPPSWEEVSPDLEPGDVQVSRNLVTSVVEEKVRSALRSAGFVVPEVKLAVLCHGPDLWRPVLPLTPDVVLVGHRIAVEVDPCGPGDSYSSHTGEEDVDRDRNVLLEAVGWTVIRLRLGAQPGGHIGDRDVVVESSGVTRDAVAALCEAIEDRIAGRAAKVRVVKKGKTPVKGERRTTVQNITKDGYSDDGYVLKWFPHVDRPEKYGLRLAMGGRFLYGPTVDGGMGFVAVVGLQKVARSKWRDLLSARLDGRDPADLGTTKWPWGDRLLEVSTAHPDSEPVVRDCESRADIDRAAFYFTTNCDDLAGEDGANLLAADGTVIASLAPEAVAVGYRLVSVELLTARWGPYQRVFVTRAPI